jgi:quercetin dioxygenase-like cupin family protein
MKLITSGQGETVWVLADRYTIKIGGADTSGAFACIEGLVPPGGGPPPHTHAREDESFYVLEGELTFFSEWGEFAAGPGAFMYLPRGRPHHFRNTGNTWARVLIVVAPAGLENLFLEVGVRQAGRTPPPFAEADVQRLLQAAHKYGIAIRP